MPPINLATHTPRTWSEIVGNSKLCRMHQLKIREVRNAAPNQKIGGSILIQGGSQEGKSTGVQLAIRGMGCNSPDPDRLEPCGKCKACCFNDPAFSDVEELFAIGLRQNHRQLIHSIVLDCTLTDSAKLNVKLSLIQDCLQTDNSLTIVYVDESHRLAKHGLEEKLLTLCTRPNSLWYFATAIPEDHDKMLLNRLTKYSTQLPTNPQLIAWGERLAELAELPVEKEALKLLAQRVANNPGKFQRGLATAQQLGESFTRQFCEQLEI